MIIKGRKLERTDDLRRYLLPDGDNIRIPRNALKAWEKNARRLTAASRTRNKKSRVHESVLDLRETLFKLLARGVALQDAAAALTTVLVQLLVVSHGAAAVVDLHIKLDGADLVARRPPKKRKSRKKPSRRE